MSTTRQSGANEIVLLLFTSASSSTTEKKKTPSSNSKSLLKDFILLPSPRIESVPRGRFREYLYGNGFAESAVGVSDQMSEEDIKTKISNIFKEKLELIPEPSYIFVRAIGNKIVRVNNGPYTGKLLKHISKQGPVYIRSVIDVSGEDLTGWLGEKLEDETSDDESLMKPAFSINDEAKVVKYTSVHTPCVEVSDDDAELVHYSKVSKSTMLSRSDCSYDSYMDILEELQTQEEEDIQRAIQESLGDEQVMDSGAPVSNLQELLKEHKQQFMKIGDPNEIIIRRTKLLETAFRAIKSKMFDCCKELVVQFSGEDAIDAGGPRREFFRLIRQDLGDISGLLEGREGHMMFTHNLKLLEENKYWLAGRLVGMSLMQDGPGLGCLDPTLYKLICGLPCDINDFDITYILDEEFLKVLQQLKLLNSEEDFKLFVQEKAEYIANQGYHSIYVAKLDQKQFIIKALIKQYMVYRVSSEIEQFKEGLNDVGGLWNKVHLYPKEFQPLFTDVPVPLSKAIFKSLYEIEWSPEGSNRKYKEDETIYCWELYLKKIEDHQMNYPCDTKELSVCFEHLLQFITGADAIPPLGFRGPLGIIFYDQEDGTTRYPYASTCAMTLALPRGHEDPTSFEMLLSRSLFDSCGFHKA